MGVLIGDEKTFIFPSFIGAVIDESVERAKEKFYGKKSNKKSKMLSRMSASFSRSKKIFIKRFIAKTNGSAESFLLDVRIFRRAVSDRLLLLEQMKKADDAINGF